MTEGYSDEVEQYYKDAPFLAQKIENKAKLNPNLYMELYQTYIEPAVREIERGNMKKAHEILRSYLKFVREII